jgi:hypothetical protein
VIHRLRMARKRLWIARERLYWAIKRRRNLIDTVMKYRSIERRKERIA